MPELWYAARVIPAAMLPPRFMLSIEQDTLPARYRYATMNLVAQGYEVYCPYFAHEIIRLGEKIRIAKALFPGYLFVRFDPITMAWRAINETRGVNHLLPIHNEVPMAVPTAFIDLIREKETMAAKEEAIKLFAVNEVVRILSGPMENQVGPVIESRREFTRVRLRLFGGRETLVKVSTRDLIAEQGEIGQ